MGSSFIWDKGDREVSREGLPISPKNMKKRVYLLPSGRKLKVVIDEDSNNADNLSYTNIHLISAQNTM